jgi:hypothetical protein
MQGRAGRKAGRQNRAGSQGRAGKEDRAEQSRVWHGRSGR